MVVEPEERVVLVDTTRRRMAASAGLTCGSSPNRAGETIVTGPKTAARGVDAIETRQQC
ncbi:hypothetical protein [Natrinema gari]|nr:hypothetical protein [Natrinema gari]